MLSRILIVDQSLKGFEWHHHIYTSSVIEAAHSMGIEPLLACHSDFEEDRLGRGLIRVHSIMIAARVMADR